MTLKIQKILYATDLSTNSALAFRHAVDCAEKHDAEIFVLHVLERIPSADDWLLKDSPLGTDLKKVYDAEKADAAEKIRNAINEFCRRELKDKPAILQRVTIQVVEGNPAAEILAKADELDPEMLVMGTHGKGFLAQAFLGSVAKKVLDRVKIPVVIVPIGKVIEEEN